MTAFKASIVFDSTNSIVPDEVREEVEDLWAKQELSNDYCYYSIDLSNIYIKEFAKEYPKLYEYLKENTPNENITILLHYSW